MPNRAVIQAKRILNIREGAGSVLLPSEYTELHLLFGLKNANGHMGPRKFAQQNIPRIAFHNPHLKINVQRKLLTKDPKNEHLPATLKLIKHGQVSEAVEGIDIKGMHSEDIVRKIIEMTGATMADAVNPTDR